MGGTGSGRKYTKEPNCITIYNGGGYNAFIVSSNNPMFQNDRVIVSIDNDCVKITTPDIDFNGKSLKPTKSRGLFKTVSVYGNELPLGTYYIDDEESNEDQMIIYLND
jgi:hypothetical protein